MMTDRQAEAALTGVTSGDNALKYLAVTETPSPTAAPSYHRHIRERFVRFSDVVDGEVTVPYAFCPICQCVPKFGTGKGTP
jgi:hypothetical protein